MCIVVNGFPSLPTSDETAPVRVTSPPGIRLGQSTHGRRRRVQAWWGMRGFVPKLLLMSLLALFSFTAARASGLHPLKVELPEAELRLTLRGTARENEDVVVECEYRPRREWDVRKERSLHLFDVLPWRIGSRDAVTVNRDEAVQKMQVVRAQGTTVSVVVPLRHPDAAYHAYQLARVRVGNIEFERWSPEPPALDAGFGLVCSPERLTGTVRQGGLAAAPLNGKLPLWPKLRDVDLTISSATAPTVRLWEARTKHHWDGWRQTTPEFWHGGETILARHVDGTTVWRTHEYYSILPAAAEPVTRPAPPAGVLPGIHVEVYWPTGDTIDLPDAHFDRPAAVLPLRASQLTFRAKELLARSVETRAGLEKNSLSAEEWRELEALVDESDPAPVEFSLRPSKDGKDRMTVQRLELKESWVYLFGVEYDSERRFGVAALLLSPAQWTGPTPE